jgi:hypothetical protein
VIAGLVQLQGFLAAGPGFGDLALVGALALFHLGDERAAFLDQQRAVEGLCRRGGEAGRSEQGGSEQGGDRVFHGSSFTG